MAHGPNSGWANQDLRGTPTGPGEGSDGPAVPDDLRALRAVVEGTATGTGQEFFRSLVRHVAEAMGVSHAVVAEFADVRTRVRTLAFWARGRIADNIEYEYAGTPCAAVVRGDFCHHPTGVSELFPNARPLVELGIDSYLAVPFLDGDGEVLGHLAVFDERPMAADSRRLFILRIFAARTAAELLRLRAERQLAESEVRYRDLYENAPVAYWVIAPGGRIINANRRISELMGYPLSEIVGQHAYFFAPKTADGSSRPQVLRRAHEAGESVSGSEIEARRKDGRAIWLKVWMVPTPGADGVQSARCIGIDITDRVLAEQERDRLHQQKLYLQEEIKSEHNFEQIVGRSHALAKVLDEVGRVAPTDATVLITGETGTGKELIARAVHSASKRRDKPLIKVNCAALPAGLVESELFGHEKGAFSGAVARRLGRFELADGGTIFLDEVGELPPDAQAKLLRVLQEREFDRVGGTAPVRVDVRVIAATNRDLAAEIRGKRFREDLHYRLNVFPVRLPPLRERRDDIPLLVHFLVGKFAPRVGKPLDGVNPETMRRLQEYVWPGNIRELENVLERAVILATGATLEIAPDLLTTPAAPPAVTAGAAPATAEAVPVAGADPPTSGQPQLQEVERDYILKVLRQTNGLIAGPRGAAKILGVNANTLRNRIKKLGLSRSHHQIG
jgi:PAS domain S-box-containing protein